MSFFFLAINYGAAAPVSDVAATVVVFNEQDPASVALAGYYAEKRGISYDHLIGLTCSLDECISREDYDKTIAEPLRKAFRSHGWWQTEADLDNGRVVGSKIRFVALMRGIPLKIAAVATYAGDNPVTAIPSLSHNEAAVDSELAVLGFATRQISGYAENPYFHKETRFSDLTVPPLLLVCRLDAAEPATVRRMIDDSLATEKNGLWGFAYVDSRGIFEAKGHGEGDRWMRQIAADAVSHGIPCIHDSAPTQFPEHYPITRAALYFGWYSAEVEGAFKDPTLRFVPGAVAVHIHSYSAGSLRPPLRAWCAPLLERGAAATLGNVFEPYLTLTPHLEIFEERLRQGFTFAEAGYASQPVLSWMTTFIGDPLYRPFKAQQNPQAKPPGSAVEYAAYRDGAERWATAGRAVGEPLLQAQAKALKSGVIYEGLGLLQAGAKDTAAALGSWASARKFYTEDADRLRCVLHTLAVLTADKKIGQALSLAREQIKRYPEAPATERLRAIVLQLDPPPPPPVPAPNPAPH